MAKKALVQDPETPEEPEEEYALTYNLWITNMTINVHDGGYVVLQTGRPKDPPPNPPGP